MKKIFLIILFCFMVLGCREKPKEISESEVYPKYVLRDETYFNQLIESIERSLNALSYRQDFFIPLKAVAGASTEPTLTKDLEAITEKLEEIADNITY